MLFSLARLKSSLTSAEQTMGNLIVGFILGIAACTVGFAGIAKIADRGVVTIQQVVKETAK